MTLAEFVIVFLIGGVIIAATIGDDRSMTNCVGAVIAVALLHRLVSWLKSRYPAFGALADGTPLVLLNNGQWQSEAMGKDHVDDGDVMAAARTKGVKTLDEIKICHSGAQRIDQHYQS